MNDSKIFLSYVHKDNYTTYEWFENEEDLKDFIKSNKRSIIQIIECFKVNQVEDITDIAERIRL